MSAAALRLGASGRSVGAARRFVAAELARAGITGDLVDTAELLVSELVTNAVLHAQTEIFVRVRGARPVVIEVQDAEPRGPLHRPHDLESVTGRGLDLVQLLAAAHGVRRCDGGKVVWFALGSGRAAEDDTATAVSGAAAAAEAVLLNVPVVLFDVMEEHAESLLREYTLHRLQHRGSSGPEPHDISIADAARTRIADGIAESIGAVDSLTVDREDVRIPLYPGDASAMRTLLDAFAHARRLALAGALLTRPALPEVRALRAWLAGEVIDQTAGAAPRPWVDDLPDSDEPAVVPAAASFDGRWVAATTTAVVVGDAHNRIVAVSPAAARLLGWTPEELVGRRLTAIIPAELRHAHLVGFIRQLATARPHLLGTPLQLAAWHRDQYALPITLLLQRHHTPDGPLFTAVLTPRH